MHRKGGSESGDAWIRLFYVSDPCLHPKGYTVYKVTSTVFPKNSPEATTEVIVWKRFSDIKKLYQCLHGLHSSLHLKGEFPDFPKDKVFGRFEPSVIEERRKSTLRLLEFVSKYPPLFTSQVFVKFFEGGRKNSSLKQEIRTTAEKPILQPIKTYEPPAIEPPSCSQPSSKTIEEHPILLGGVWQYRQAPDELSLDSNDDSDDATQKDNTDATLSPNSSVDLTLFDPFGSSSKEGDTEAAKTDVSNAWLLSALASCSQSTGVSEDGSGGTPRPLIEFPKAFAEFEDEELPVYGSNEHSSPLDVVASPSRTDAVGADVERLGTPIGDSEKDTREEVDASLQRFSFGDAGEKTDSVRRASEQLLFDGTVSFAQFKNDVFGDYLLSAAASLKLAQDSEANGEYEEAFNYYKAVVGTLLTGVQEDLDPIRRDAVRRKTAQYLQKAEDIYLNHLKNSETQDEVQTCEQQLQHRLLKFSAVELGRYKVLGIMGKVLLVLDAAADATYVIKVLSKSSRLNALRPCIVPSDLPHMVQLVRYHETDQSIFLVLSHAVGGKLWHYVSSYLRSTAPTHNLDFQPSLESVNVYAGKNLLSRSGSHQDETDALQGHRETVKPGGRRRGSDPMAAELEEGVQSADCSPSYVKLLTDYVASTSVGGVFLAECQFAAYRKNATADEEEAAMMHKAPVDGGEALNCKSSGNRDCSSAFNDYAFDQSIGAPVLEFSSSIDLEKVDPHDLISKAQKLMEHVDVTLKECNQVSQSNGCEGTMATCARDESAIKQSGLVSPPSPVPMQTRRASENSWRRLRSQTSEDAFVSPGHDARLERKSSSGSLELHSNRVRHFSSVFRQLDESAGSCLTGLPESCIRIWAAEIVEAVSELHVMGLICRDLKPDNILLGERGHILITYFSQWPSVDYVVDSVAKECLYTAPEVGGIFEATYASDWWSVGALLFELLTGKTLLSCHPGGLTAHTELNIPCALSLEATSLLKGLLCYNPNERLGGSPEGVESIKAHPFFQSVDWGDLSEPSTSKSQADICSFDS